MSYLHVVGDAVSQLLAADPTTPPAPAGPAGGIIGNNDLPTTAPSSDTFRRIIWSAVALILAVAIFITIFWSMLDLKERFTRIYKRLGASAVLIVFGAVGLGTVAWLGISIVTGVFG